jgi:hypothetical protein
MKNYISVIFIVVMAIGYLAIGVRTAEAGVVTTDSCDDFPYWTHLLCTAYCEKLDCDTAIPQYQILRLWLCKTYEAAFVKKTGIQPPCDPCDDCPCDYYSIPPTATCWPDAIWEDNQGVCQLTEIFSQFPLDESQSGLFYGNAQCVAGAVLGSGADPPDCPLLSEPNYNVGSLTADQLEACRQCLVQYVNEVAQGGTVVGDPLDCTPPP